MTTHPQAPPRQTVIRRRCFAAIRVVQVTLAVLSSLCLLLTLTMPQGRDRLSIQLYAMAQSTPRTFIFAALLLLLTAVALQLLARPLKRRWHEDLRGWIK